MKIHTQITTLATAAGLTLAAGSASAAILVVGSDSWGGSASLGADTAGVDEGSDSPDVPGAADPSGFAKMGGPTMSTVERGVTLTPPVIQLRRPDAGS